MVRIRVFSPFHYSAPYLSSIYQKGSAVQDRWGFDKQLYDINSRTDKNGQHIFWTNMTAHSAEGNTSSCQTRRWDQELGLVPKADMASQITDLRMGGCVGVSSLYLLPLRENLCLKLMCIWVQIPFLLSTFILFAFFTMIWDSSKTWHRTEYCSELQRNTFPLCG